MSFSIKSAGFCLCLAAGLMACSENFGSSARLVGIWQQTGRKCSGNGPCSIAEKALTLTIRPDRRVILTTGRHTGRFILEGEGFYRIYSPDRRLAFSFEVLSLSDNKMILLLYNQNMQKQDTYSFDRIEEIRGI